MEITERRVDKNLILVLSGRVDMVTADQLRDSLLPLVDQCAAAKESIVVDFSGVDYISSAGLRVLMLAAKQAKTSGGKVAVAALQPVVLEIFQISRFDKVLDCYPQVQDAINALAG